MSQGYARIAGKVVGPEGLGRMGTVTFDPLPQYKGVEVDATNARIIAGTEVDLVDIFSGVAIEDPSDRDGRRVRDIGDGTLEAINAPDVIEVGDGLLAWRTND